MSPQSSRRALAVAIAAAILVGGFAAPAAAALSSGGPAIASSIDSDGETATTTDETEDVETTASNASDSDTDLNTESDDGDDEIADTDPSNETGDGESVDDEPLNETGDDEQSDDEIVTDGTSDAESADETVDDETSDAALEASIDEAKAETDALGDATAVESDLESETTGALETATESVDAVAEIEDAEVAVETATDVEATGALEPTRLETVTATASLEAAATGASDAAAGGTDGSAASSTADSDAASSADGADGATDDRESEPATDGETAADAVLVGLLGAITASSAAGGAGAGAGVGSGAGAGTGGTATSPATNRPRSSPVSLRRLREIGSVLPWKFLSILGYSRYDDSDPLENDCRREIYELIRDDPGCYLSEVGDRCDVSLSTVRHHVRVLEEEGLIASATIDGKRRYVASEDEDEAELHAALAQPSKREVLEALTRLGPATNGALADELDRDPSTVSHHLSSLADDGLVVREKDGRSVVNELAPGIETALCSEDAPLEDGSTDPSDPSASAPADD